MRISAPLLAPVLLIAGGLRQPLPRAADQGITKAGLNPAVKTGSKSSYASCFDATDGRYLGSQTVRTETLVSLDGRFRAYAESEAAGSEADVGFPTCTNTSRLFVAGPDNQFRVVLAVEPVPDRHGNSIALVDWSPAGHRLLVAEGIWEWASEVGETDVRTYDAMPGSSRQKHSWLMRSASTLPALALRSLKRKDFPRTRKSS